LGPKGCARRTVETDREGLVAFGVRVVDDGHREGLGRLAGGEGHGAQRVDVIAAG